MHGHDSSQPVRVTAWVRGRVQQVGFRWWTRARALEIGLAGYASNLGDGRVQVVAEGPHADCEQLLELLRGPDTPGKVTGVTEIWSATGTGYDSFAIR
ncbi:acylphosphatase [Kitasatospora sp. MAP5-34]|uniref:acylphosphatase n=1 Tax=Kitasatospora sp. MAP5-34 TaxID=3035102 RepID=UPI002474A665|nr:acylphosphatase [Kitasatospora sp. MAP5-34]MDH6578912.1 acylphosphatase [Kitasatospora sp. MAP5-34]